MLQAQQRLLIISGVILVVLVSITALVISDNIVQQAMHSQTEGNTLDTNMTGDGAPLLGSPTAPYTLVVFMDYACPHCAAYQAVIDAFIEQYVYTGQMRIEFRVVSGLDPTGSPLAAQAALCAAAQSTFLPIHRELLAMQQAYERSPFTEARILTAADRQNMDTADLTTCLRATIRYTNILQNNVAVARQMGVQTLPYLVLRDRQGNTIPLQLGDAVVLPGRPGFDLLSAALDSGPVSQAR